MDLEVEVRGKLEGAMDGAEVLIDFADGKHMAVEIRAKQFSGKSLIEQHKMVYAAVQDLINQGYLHALKIKTVVKN